jgi:zinc transporter 1
MLILNFACFVMEFAIGFTFNSMVLTADAFNVLSDFLGVVIALVCMKISAKGPSERNTFGWTRCDVLGALINAVFMIALCVSIFLDSLQRFIQPEPVDQPLIVLIVGVVGLMVNLVGMFVLKEYRSAPKKQKQSTTPPPTPMSINADIISESMSPESTATISSKKGASSHMNMYGAYLHILGDALGSVVVIICALIDWQVTTVPFLQNYLDPMLSIVVAILLAISSFSLMKESSLTLLQAVPTHVNMMNLKTNILEKSPHIVEITNLHVWQLSSEKLVASVRIRFDDSLPWEKLIRVIGQVENCFYDEGIHVVTVHPEIIDSTDGHPVILEPVQSRHGSIIRTREDEMAGVMITAELPLRVSIHGKPAHHNEDVTVWM